MSRYDDERVIALLRECVPPPPDAPERLDAVRRRAGQQRVTVWTQTLGVAASVLLILGVVAVATGSSGAAGRVEPLAEPLVAVAAAFGDASSVRFEATMQPAGDVDAGGTMMSRKQLEQVLTSRATGAATRDGDLQIDGDLSFIMSWATADEPAAEHETHLRFVDGKSYRSATPGDEVPPGKKWLLEEGDSQTSAADLDRALAMVRAVAEDVRYVRGTTVRGTPVAEYRFTVPERWAKQRLEVTFALDSRDRLRRVATEFDWLTVLTGGDDLDYAGPKNPMRVRVELVLFGYGDDVDIEAPPASEVVSAEAVYEEEQRALEECMTKATDDEQRIACYKAHVPQGVDEIGVMPDGGECEETMSADGSSTTTCSGSGGSSGWVSVGASPPPARPSPASTRSPSP